MRSGQRPTDLPGVLSDLEERVRRLEHARDTVVGNWVVEQNDAGELVARHAPSGATTVVAVP